MLYVWDAILADTSKCSRYMATLESHDRSVELVWEVDWEVEFEVDGRTRVQRAKQRSLVLWIDGYVMAAVPCYPGWDSGRLGWGLRFPVRPGHREIHAEQESGETPTEYWRVRGGRDNNPGSQPYRRGGGSGVQPVGGPRLDDLRSHGVSYAQHNCASVTEPIET